jgi:hypothetical protein
LPGCGPSRTPSPAWLLRGARRPCSGTPKCPVGRGRRSHDGSTSTPPRPSWSPRSRPRAYSGSRTVTCRMNELESRPIRCERCWS